MASLVEAYGVADIQQYWVGSYCRNPADGNKVQQIADAGNTKLYFVKPGGDPGECPMKFFDWSMARYPELGYRSDRDGLACVHLSRSPGRVTRKGFRSDTIRISVLESTNIATRLSDRYRAAKAKIAVVGFDLAELAFNPIFFTLKDAVANILDSKKEAINHAINGEFAVSVYPGNNTNLALYFAGAAIPVATSMDGTRWDWANAKARDIAVRTGVIQ